MFPGQVLEGLQGIGDKHHGLVTMVVVIYLLVVDHGQGATLVKRLGCKLVAVKRFAFQGNEDAALGAVATISRDARMLLVDGVKFFAIHNLFILFATKLQ